MNREVFRSMQKADLVDFVSINGTQYPTYMGMFVIHDPEAPCPLPGMPISDWLADQVDLVNRGSGLPSAPPDISEDALDYALRGYAIQLEGARADGPEYPTVAQKRQMLENIIELSRTNAAAAIFLAKNHLGMADL